MVNEMTAACAREDSVVRVRIKAGFQRKPGQLYLAHSGQIEEIGLRARVEFQDGSVAACPEDFDPRPGMQCARSAECPYRQSDRVPGARSLNRRLDGCGVIAVIIRGRSEAGDVDRKSTRLNSSH